MIAARAASTVAWAAASRRSWAVGNRKSTRRPPCSSSNDPSCACGTRTLLTSTASSSASSHAGHAVTSSSRSPNAAARASRSTASRRPSGQVPTPSAPPAAAAARTTLALDRMSAHGLLPHRQDGALVEERCGHAVNVRAPLGSGTSVSRSQPSFSSLMCWIATAFALASRSGSAWYSETQQRKTL